MRPPKDQDFAEESRRNSGLSTAVLPLGVSVISTHLIPGPARRCRSAVMSAEKKKMGGLGIFPVCIIAGVSQLANRTKDIGYLNPLLWCLFPIRTQHHDKPSLLK